MMNPHYVEEVVRERRAAFRRDVEHEHLLRLARQYRAQVARRQARQLDEVSGRAAPRLGRSSLVVRLINALMALRRATLPA
jgi:hypothetical protein